MFIYVVLFVLPLLGLIFDSQQKSQYLYLSISILQCSILCFGYMTGSDWRVYEYAYTQLDSFNLRYNFWEPGFIFYFFIGNSLKIPFWILFILTKCVIFFRVLYVLKKYSPFNWYLENLFFTIYFGVFLFIDNPMRNLIAIFVFSYSFEALIDKKWIRYYFIVLLSMLFHSSALFLIFLYPIYHLRFSPKIILLLFVTINVFFGFFLEQMLFLVTKLFSISPFLYDKFIIYSESDYNKGESAFSLGFVFISILLLLIVSKFDFFYNKSRRSQFIIKMTVIYILMYGIGSHFSIIYRLQLYMSICFALGVIYCGIAFVEKSRIVYFVSICLFVSALLYKTVTGSYKYIPYTNYLMYPLKYENMNFHEREIYNFNHSPYSNKK